MLVRAQQRCADLEEQLQIAANVRVALHPVMPISVYVPNSLRLSRT